MDFTLTDYLVTEGHLFETHVFDGSDATTGMADVVLAATPAVRNAVYRSGATVSFHSDEYQQRISDDLKRMIGFLKD